ncbi:MAG TPA: PadR family transcriptional regulator, partial [Chitinophagales bacterium]|nr:PadR family transcriptional regulator [Chitinophagales bacterium]
LLTRLKNAGLLTYEWKESNSGPPRKYFTLTLDGQSALDDLKGTWNELSNAVEKASNYQKIEESN